MKKLTQKQIDACLASSNNGRKIDIAVLLEVVQDAMIESNVVSVADLDIPDGWQVTTSGPSDFLTAEANARARVHVSRTLPPFCSEEGERTWCGPTLVDALDAAHKDLGLPYERPSVQLEQLQNKVNELERLCDATYVAQGADAYNHACDEMERFQQERIAAGRDAGTEGSLCDGMAWLYERIDELESALDESVSIMQSAERELRASQAVLGTSGSEGSEVISKIKEFALRARTGVISGFNSRADQKLDVVQSAAQQLITCIQWLSSAIASDSKRDIQSLSQRADELCGALNDSFKN